MTAEKGEQTQALVAAALDYYEGWFDGEPQRMERALHPDLVKRSLASDGWSVDTISAREMVEATADGTGRTRDPGTTVATSRSTSITCTDTSRR